MNQFSDDRGAELRELFFESAGELLQSLNDEAMKLEKRPGDPETVRTIRRIVHTLKGDAAASGFQELSELAHELEDALALETAAAHGSLPEITFKAADIFGEMLSAYRGQTKLPSTAGLRKRIRELAQAPKARKSRAKKNQAANAAPTVWTEYEKLATQAAAEKGRPVYDIRVLIDPQCAMPIAARQLVLKALSGLGEVLGSRPEPGSTESTKQFQLLMASDKAPQLLAAKCRIPTVAAQVQVQLIEFPPHKVGHRSKSTAASPAVPMAGTPPGLWLAGV
ncbi:MAG: Hpt domain-containing protein, partial [Acidobacteriia bacterium]|nr:Hpt domain-containing protein [Terriglobia bacterium]